VKGTYSGRYGQLAGTFTELKANSVSGDVSVVHTERSASAAAESADAASADAEASS